MTPFRLLCLVLVLALGATCPALSAEHLDIRVSLDPESQSLRAQASITTQASGLVFYLADDFVVESIEVNGATMPADLSSLESLRRFQIDLHDAETASTVMVRYHGLLQPLDTAMTHDETLGGLPAMSSEAGAYLPGNSGWHPVLESAFTYRLETAVPQGYLAVAPGTPDDESETDGIRRASFSMATPVDSIDLMAGRWALDERVALIGEINVRLRTYFDETESPLSNGYLDAAQRFIERYSKEIGPYPYAIFSVVSSPIPTGFGMPTLTYLGKAVLPYPFIRDISLGHEVLHSWWGNGIRVDPVRGNWAEGLTTFMADYAYREDKSAQDAMRMRHGWLRSYATLPPESERRLSAFRVRQHTASAAIGYGKAAMMFYDLRARLGNESFLQGVRIFWARHRYGAASFDDLREAFEKASGAPLTEFFEQWLERTGAPEIRVVSARLTNTTGTELELELAQHAGPNGDKPYTVSVPLRLSNSGAKLDVRVELSEPQEKVTITTTTIPTSVQIDPAFEVWRKLLPKEAPPVLRDVIASRHILVAALEPVLTEGAEALASALGEGDVIAVGPADRADSHPLIIAGSKGAVRDYLDGLGRAVRPALIAPAPIEVWITPDPGQRIVAVAIDPAATKGVDLARLGRRLRHLGSYSWVSISADGTTRQGHWPNETPRIAVVK